MLAGVAARQPSRRLHRPVHQSLIALRFNILHEARESGLMMQPSLSPNQLCVPPDRRANPSDGMLITSTGRSFEDVPACALISSPIGRAVCQEGPTRGLPVPVRAERPPTPPTTDTCASACARLGGGRRAEDGGVRNGCSSPSPPR